jgi:hypothetical protein
MPTEACSNPFARPEPLARHQLDALAEVLAASATDQAAARDVARSDDGLLAVGVARSEPSQLELHLRPLADGGGDPVADLLGWQAPARWQAVGVVGRGTTVAIGRADDGDRTTGDPGVDGSAAGPPERQPGTPATFAHLVGRDGASASVASVDGEPWPPGGSDAAPQGQGRIPDLCRRALGLPTPAPAGGSGPLHALRWLDAVAVAALRAPGRLSWPDVVACHPAARETPTSTSTTAGADVPGPVELAVLAARHAASWPWERSRRACAERRWAIDGLAPEHAAWMDAGVFSRWSLATFPPPDELVGLAEHLLAHPAAAALRAVLTVSGVLRDQGPDRVRTDTAV